MNDLLNLLDAYVNVTGPAPWRVDQAAGLALADRLEEWPSPWAATVREVVLAPIVVPAIRARWMRPTNGMLWGDGVGVEGCPRDTPNCVALWLPLAQGATWNIGLFPAEVAVTGYGDTALGDRLCEVWTMSTLGIDLPAPQPGELVVAAANGCKVKLVASLLPVEESAVSERVDAIDLRIQAEIERVSANAEGSES